MQRQPVELINIPDALLKTETVELLIGRSRATINRMIAAGQFVKPIKRGTRCVRFRAGDVSDWMKEQGRKAVEVPELLAA